MINLIWLSIFDPIHMICLSKCELFLLTTQNSPCKCPRVGRDMALRTRSETLEGPGPMRVLAGTLMGLSRAAGAVTVRLAEDMLTRWLRKTVLEETEADFVKLGVFRVS